MPDINLGRIGFVPRGAYQTGTTYKPLDAVRHGNHLWACVTQTTTAPATSNAAWTLLLQGTPDGSVDAVADTTALRYTGGRLKVGAPVAGADAVTLDALLAFPAAGGGLTVTNGHAYVDFSTMPTDKFEALLQSLRLQIWLTANKTWYVNGASGNNNNDGSESSKAFKTINYAANYVASNFNVDIYTGTINVAPGVYTEKINLPKYNSTSGRINIVGESYDTTILVGSINGLTSAGQWGLLDIAYRSDGQAGPGASTTSVGIFLNAGCSLSITRVYGDFDVVPNIDAGVTASLPIFIYDGSIEILEGCEINMPSRAAGQSFWQNLGGTITLRQATVLNGDVSVATINQLNGSVFRRINTPNSPPAIITGTVTGKRYQGTQGSTFNAGGGGANYFPGTIAGTTSGDLYS
jgi:hypothetical protein